ncbi:hypothetical protein DIPPA_18526 [Diplonema papillatum]|nr:hypothetical protein DIPPA_18526 [Diplonema papillatum]
MESKPAKKAKARGSGDAKRGAKAPAARRPRAQSPGYQLSTAAHSTRCGAVADAAAALARARTETALLSPRPGARRGAKRIIVVPATPPQHPSPGPHTPRQPRSSSVKKQPRARSGSRPRPAEKRRAASPARKTPSDPRFGPETTTPLPWMVEELCMEIEGELEPFNRVLLEEVERGGRASLAEAEGSRRLDAGLRERKKRELRHRSRILREVLVEEEEPRGRSAVEREQAADRAGAKKDEVRGRREAVLDGRERELLERERRLVEGRERSVELDEARSRERVEATLRQRESWYGERERHIADRERSLQRREDLEQQRIERFLDTTSSAAAPSLKGSPQASRMCPHGASHPAPLQPHSEQSLQRREDFEQQRIERFVDTTGSAAAPSPEGSHAAAAGTHGPAASHPAPLQPHSDPSLQRRDGLEQQRTERFVDTTSSAAAPSQASRACPHGTHGPATAHPSPLQPHSESYNASEPGRRRAGSGADGEDCARFKSVLNIKPPEPAEKRRGSARADVLSEVSYDPITMKSLSVTSHADSCRNGAAAAAAPHDEEEEQIRPIDRLSASLTSPGQVGGARRAANQHGFAWQQEVSAAVDHRPKRQATASLAARKPRKHCRNSPVHRSVSAESLSYESLHPQSEASRSSDPAAGPTAGEPREAIADDGAARAPPESSSAGLTPSDDHRRPPQAGGAAPRRVGAESPGAAEPLLDRRPSAASDDRFAGTEAAAAASRGEQRRRLQAELARLDLEERAERANAGGARLPRMAPVGPERAAPVGGYGGGVSSKDRDDESRVSSKRAPGNRESRQGSCVSESAARPVPSYGADGDSESRASCRGDVSSKRDNRKSLQGSFASESAARPAPGYGADGDNESCMSSKRGNGESRQGSCVSESAAPPAPGYGADGDNESRASRRGDASSQKARDGGRGGTPTALEVSAFISESAGRPTPRSHAGGEDDNEPRSSYRRDASSHQREGGEPVPDVSEAAMRPAASYNAGAAHDQPAESRAQHPVAESHAARRPEAMSMPRVECKVEPVRLAEGYGSSAGKWHGPPPQNTPVHSSSRTPDGGGLSVGVYQAAGSTHLAPGAARQQPYEGEDTRRTGQSAVTILYTAGHSPPSTSRHMTPSPSYGSTPGGGNLGNFPEFSAPDHHHHHQHQHPYQPSAAVFRPNHHTSSVSRNTSQSPLAPLRPGHPLSSPSPAVSNPQAFASHHHQPLDDCPRPGVAVFHSHATPRKHPSAPISVPDAFDSPQHSFNSPPRRAAGAQLVGQRHQSVQTAPAPFPPQKQPQQPPPARQEKEDAWKQPSAASSASSLAPIDSPRAAGHLGAKPFSEPSVEQGLAPGVYRLPATVSSPSSLLREPGVVAVMRPKVGGLVSAGGGVPAWVDDDGDADDDDDARSTGASSICTESGVRTQALSSLAWQQNEAVKRCCMFLDRAPPAPPAVLHLAFEHAQNFSAPSVPLRQATRAVNRSQLQVPKLQGVEPKPFTFNLSWKPTPAQEDVLRDLIRQQHHTLLTLAEECEAAGLEGDWAIDAVLNYSHA